MSNSRTRILERIARTTGGSSQPDNIEATFEALCRNSANAPVQPEIGLADAETTFTQEAHRNGARVTPLTDPAQVEAWLKAEVQASSVPPQLHCSPTLNLRLSDIEGTDSKGTPAASGSWGLVRAHTAIAETGTVMSLSRECPSGLLFLVERLIVVIARKDIVGYQEDAWQRLRAEKALPRTVNWITGPSRTADIEQQIQIGAHGPREVDYLLIDEQ